MLVLGDPGVSKLGVKKNYFLSRFFFPSKLPTVIFDDSMNHEYGAQMAQIRKPVLIRKTGTPEHSSL